MALALSCVVTAMFVYLSPFWSLAFGAHEPAESLLNRVRGGCYRKRRSEDKNRIIRKFCRLTSNPPFTTLFVSINQHEVHMLQTAHLYFLPGYDQAIHKQCRPTRDLLISAQSRFVHHKTRTPYCSATYTPARSRAA